MTSLFGGKRIVRRRRRVGARRVRRVRRGMGFFGDVWEGIKSVAPVINSVLKSTGVAGNLAKMIPGVGTAASAGLKALGYGRRRRVRRVRRVGGVRKVRTGVRRTRRTTRGGLVMTLPRRVYV